MRSPQAHQDPPVRLVGRLGRYDARPSRRALRTLVGRRFSALGDRLVEASCAVRVHRARDVVVRFAAEQAPDGPVGVCRDERREVAAGQAAQRVTAGGPQLLAQRPQTVLDQAADPADQRSDGLYQLPCFCCRVAVVVGQQLIVDERQQQVYREPTISIPSLWSSTRTSTGRWPTTAAPCCAVCRSTTTRAPRPADRRQSPSSGRRTVRGRAPHPYWRRCPSPVSATIRWTGTAIAG
jgi:hypothetical protein